MYLPRRLLQPHLAQQQVPTIPALWELVRYEDFLAERRERLAAAINQFMESLLAEEAKPTIHNPRLYRGWWKARPSSSKGPCDGTSGNSRSTEPSRR